MAGPVDSLLSHCFYVCTGNGAERLQVAWLALRFALLALGCVVWFTGAVRDAEVADLQILVAQCLVALRAEAHHAPDTTAELTSQGN